MENFRNPIDFVGRKEVNVQAPVPSFIVMGKLNWIFRLEQAEQVY